ncbi:hypothetical protein [Rhizobium sp. 42MFCr.1]|uniref:hypothetical protein n=1 Tax=Rhizobium sp. 42MFCr.1 TaxID=1048680 RepID=UPI001FD8EFB7|nr:hypothetical protein [Rhizobium sp. 42MFCr.1]
MLSVGVAAGVTVTVSVVNEAVAARVAGAVAGVDGDELSGSVGPALATENFRTGALDVSLTLEPCRVGSGAADSAGSSDVVTISVEGSGGRTVRGFGVCGSEVEESAVGVVAVVSAKLVPPVVSPAGEAVEAPDVCDAAAFVKGVAVVVDPVSGFTELTALKSATALSLADELTVALTKRALPVAAAL